MANATKVERLKKAKDRVRELKGELKYARQDARAAEKHLARCDKTVASVLGKLATAEEKVASLTA